jgi:hypothetical protein
MDLQYSSETCLGAPTCSAGAAAAAQVAAAHHEVGIAFAKARLLRAGET